MNGFKLLAIRPLKGCGKSFLKILKPDTLYQFYHDYQFEFEGNDNSKRVIEISHNPTTPDSLYNQKDVNINVSAIVGKNGSGKSSLIDLFYACIYNLGIETGFPNYAMLEKLNDLNVEIFYSINDDIFCLKIEPDSKHSFDLFKESTNSILNALDLNRIKKYFIVKNKPHERLSYFFFYTISINYSLYGLNSKHMGEWLNSLFHKNDGYQTPVVINPFREDGCIDVNRELYLAKQRLLSNVLKPIEKDKDESHRYLTDKQKVSHITFSIDKEKIEYAYKKGDSESDIVYFDEFYKIHQKDEILMETYRVFYGDRRPLENVKYKEEVEDYIVKKLIKIVRTYSEYKDVYSFHDELIIHIGKIGSTEQDVIKYSKHFENLDSYLRDLVNDRSHITFKLRQALNYLMYDILNEDIENGIQWKNTNGEENESTEQLIVPVENLSRVINQKLEVNDRLIEYIPPSIFNIELHLESLDNSKSVFSELSSGEQQLIHSIQCVLYHLYNLNSVFEGQKKDGKITYQTVNLIFDEIELYFHPEYQRLFINQLVKALQKINLSEINSYNILLCTHSPFILSDIPSSNILRLDEGKPVVNQYNEQTFGANIHRLLHNDFFLENGFIGEFAKSKIEEVIKFLNVMKLLKEYDSLVNNIPEKSNSLKIARVMQELKYINSNAIYRNKKNTTIINLMKKEYDFNKMKEYWNIINCIGEPIIKSKLEAMYIDLLGLNDDNKKSTLKALAFELGYKLTK